APARRTARPSSLPSMGPAPSAHGQQEVGHDRHRVRRAAKLAGESGMSLETAFTGRTAVAPELRASAAGKPWARFGAAVGEGDDVRWVQVACFGEVAQRLPSALGKGDRCYVEGTLRLDE